MQGVVESVSQADYFFPESFFLNLNMDRRNHERDLGTDGNGSVSFLTRKVIPIP